MCGGEKRAFGLFVGEACEKLKGGLGWKHKGFISVHLRLIFPSTRMALFLLCAALQPFVLLVRAKNVAYGSSSEMYGKKGNSVK